MIVTVLYIIFFSTLLIQFVYYFRYFRTLYHYNPITINPNQYKISVVICAHNEQQNLKQNLQSILDQNYPDFEVIIIDDRSTDNTSEVVKSFSDDEINLIRIDVVKNGESPKKNALTKGFEASTGEFVLLTDADCKPNSENWITKMVEHIKPSTDLILGYSPYQTNYGLLNKLIQFDTFFTAIQYLSFALKGEAFMGVGRNLLIKKEAFFNVNGFDGFEKILAGDDDVIVQKIAKKGNVEICIDKESHIISQPETTFSNWFSQKRRHLSVGAEYKNKYKWKVGFFQQSFVFMYLSFFMLLFYNSDINLFILAFVSLFVLKPLFIFKSLNKKLQTTIPFYILPLLEVLHFFAFLLIGSSVLIKSKRTWR